MKRYLTIAVVIGLVMSASVAVAQVSDDGVIHACASTRRGNLRVVDAPEDCRRTETPVSWNQVGPQGLPGLAGVDGTDGVDGVDGVDGSDGESCSVVEDPVGTFTMTCPDSSNVTWSVEKPGPIVMTASGNSWLTEGRYAFRDEFSRWGTETTFFVPATAVISLTGPGSINGVEYGLESFDLCVITDSNFVFEVAVTGIAPFGSDVDDDQYLDLFYEAFPDPGLTTGCYTFVVNKPVGQGAGLRVGIMDIRDYSPVTLSSVRSVWTPEAAQG